MADNYLVHYGIKGQKWYERRFQNPDGSLTAAGRIRYGVGQAVKKVSSGARIVINKSKQKYKTVQEEHKEKQEQKAEEDKQSVIRSANAKRILDYQDKLTTQELNDALNRVRSVTALNDQVAKDKKAAEDAANYNKKSHRIGRKIAKLADFSLNTVNTVQKFVDAGKKFSKWFNDEDSMPDLNKMTLDDALKSLDKLKVNDIAKVLGAQTSKEKILENQKPSKPAPNQNAGGKDNPPQTVDPTPAPETKPIGNKDSVPETKTSYTPKDFKVSDSKSSVIQEKEGWDYIQNYWNDKREKENKRSLSDKVSKNYAERFKQSYRTSILDSVSEAERGRKTIDSLSDDELRSMGW